MRGERRGGGGTTGVVAKTRSKGVRNRGERGGEGKPRCEVGTFAVGGSSEGRHSEWIAAEWIPARA